MTMNRLNGVAKLDSIRRLNAVNKNKSRKIRRENRVPSTEFVETLKEGEDEVEEKNNSSCVSFQF